MSDPADSAVDSAADFARKARGLGCWVDPKEFARPATAEGHPRITSGAPLDTPPPVVAEDGNRQSADLPQSKSGHPRRKRPGTK